MPCRRRVSACATTMSDTGLSIDECLRVNTAPCGDRESSSGQRRTVTRQEQLPLPVMRKKSQQHSKRCRTRFDILCATAIGEGASKPRRGSELHQTVKCHEMPNQLQFQQCSMRESEETQRRSVQEASDTTHDLGERSQGFGSEPRQEATQRVDDENSQRSSEARARSHAQPSQPSVMTQMP